VGVLGYKEPWGFVDFDAILLFLKGPKYSLLYFWDTPTFFWGHLIAFELACFLFIIGFWTRTMGVLTFFLMNSLFFRNHLFWEGAELVYRVTLAYLICSKCGHAWSVDNWLRCRKLGKQGLLSERGGPGNGAGVAPSEDHPRGLEAVYRLIPRWPRVLLMLQFCAIYAYTGMVKNGSVWGRGDAIYYAWNMDHFYRFYPQQISALIGTNLLRVATWVSHWGEVFFFIVMFGVVTLWAHHNKIRRLAGARLWAVRAMWLTLAAGAGAIVYVTWPVHVVGRGLLYDRRFFLGLWAGSCALVAGWWWLLGRGIRIRKMPLWTPGKKFHWHPFSTTIVLDRVWFSTWFLGRRVWVVFAVGLMKTAPLGSVLDGITRDAVIRIARDKGINVVEQPFTRDELYIADEAFLTGTAAEVTPVREVDDRTIGSGGRGPVTTSIQAAYFDAVRGRERKYEHWLTKI
jgi:hypothetical protein